MKHSPTYSPTLIAAAELIARRTWQQRGVRLVRKRGLQCLARTVGNEALPLLANQVGRWS